MRDNSLDDIKYLKYGRSCVMRDTGVVQAADAVSALFFLSPEGAAARTRDDAPDVGRRMTGVDVSLDAANRYCCFFAFFQKL